MEFLRFGQKSDRKWPHRESPVLLDVFQQIPLTIGVPGGLKQQNNDGRKFKKPVEKTRVAKTPRPQRGFFDIWPRKKQPTSTSKKTPRVSEVEKDLIYSQSKIN